MNTPAAKNERKKRLGAATGRLQFPLQDLMSVVAYLAVLIWFSSHLLQVYVPTIRNRPLSESLPLVATVALTTGTVMTLPQLWFFYATRSLNRKSIILPGLTIAALAYSSFATVPMVAAVGLGSILQLVVVMVLSRWRRTNGNRTNGRVSQGRGGRLSVSFLLIFQTVILLIVGLAFQA